VWLNFGLLAGWKDCAMKRLLAVLLLLVAVSAFADSGGVTAHLRVISVTGTHTHPMFICNITLDNQTGATLTATNLFCESPGLALKVAGSDGQELARAYAGQWKIWQFYIYPGSHTFTNLYYGYNIYNVSGFSIPESTKELKLQLVGTLAGSSYTNRVTSNVIEMQVP
jgi:hypothetical protein